MFGALLAALQARGELQGFYGDSDEWCCQGFRWILRADLRDRCPHALSYLYSSNSLNFLYSFPIAVRYAVLASDHKLFEVLA
jgi:hypothetical protein